jgi:ribosomal 50S subunit-associated protein YjgA (DUF615 family)
MSNRYMDGDAAAEMLERRWFATYKSAEALRSECEMLQEVVATAEAAWRRALARLAELERLRDALGDELSRIDEQYPQSAPRVVRRSVMSAA